MNWSFWPLVLIKIKTRSRRRFLKRRITISFLTLPNNCIQTVLGPIVSKCIFFFFLFLFLRAAGYGIPVARKVLLQRSVQPTQRPFVDHDRSARSQCRIFQASYRSRFLTSCNELLRCNVVIKKLHFKELKWRINFTELLFEQSEKFSPRKLLM